MNKLIILTTIILFSSSAVADNGKYDLEYAKFLISEEVQTSKCVADNTMYDVGYVMNSDGLKQKCIKLGRFVKWEEE